MLKDVSQHTNFKQRHVAELILSWARDGTLPADVRVAFEQALQRRSPTQLPGSEQD